MEKLKQIEAHKFNAWVPIAWEQAQKGDIVRIHDDDGARFVGLFRVERNDIATGDLIAHHVRPK